MHPHFFEYMSSALQPSHETWPDRAYPPCHPLPTLLHFKRFEHRSKSCTYAGTRSYHFGMWVGGLTRSLLIFWQLMNILVHVVSLMPEFYFSQIPMPFIPSIYLTEWTLYLLQPLKKNSPTSAWIQTKSAIFHPYLLACFPKPWFWSLFYLLVIRKRKNMKRKRKRREEKISTDRGVKHIHPNKIPEVSQTNRKPE